MSSRGNPIPPHGSLFRVRLWCSDCTGQDPDGCFEGGNQILCDSKSPWPVLTFPSVDAAKEAGYERTFDCSPWGFDVLDEDDEVVFSSDA